MREMTKEIEKFEHIIGKEILNEIRNTIKRLAQADISVRDGRSSNEERVRKILDVQCNKNGIVSYCYFQNYKKYGDFLLIVVKKGKHIPLGLRIRESEKKADEQRKRRSEIEKGFSHPGFIKSFVIVVNSQMTDLKIRDVIKKNIKQFQES
ncbi:MAG: hypothetical protein HQ537_01125 [Parcubacteria group bacterium]|nr:hypothetical protein [Parcubacteria group bacterium]